MAYPTPSIYTYRVVQVAAVNAANDAKAYFIAEFSTDSGTTWNPVLQNIYWSLQEAYQAIGKIVANEAKFQKQYLQVKKFENPKLVPTRTVFAYPPA